MQSLKAVLILVFTIFSMNDIQSQEMGEWSFWKSDKVFEKLEMRYKKIEKENNNILYEVECRNRFSHKLTYFLVFDQNYGERRFIKLNLGENEKVAIKPEFNLDPEGLKIYTDYSSLAPAWPRGFEIQK